MFTAALLTAAKIQKQPKCPEIDKEDVVLLYIQWTTTQLPKENEMLLFAITHMGLESIILSEIIQTEKGRYHTFSLIYVKSKK